MKITSTEVQQKEKNEIKRYPNLQTVLMVEATLQKHRDVPLKLSELKEKLPKQIMHQTLLVILNYLWRSGKIMYGPRGVLWIYTEPAHLQSMLDGALEV
ncbi:hypothetical protein FJZ22_02750 [Candidatus Pacearchaeota archaeon]|nr:hypothetical protein [Candidatus Pacearchaeota archaeon]